MTTQTGAERAARNLELVRAGYDDFGRGDLAAVEELFDPEVIWHAQRLGALSGDHKGWPELLRFFGDTMELTRGTFRVTVTVGYASPGGVAVMVRSQAERDAASSTTARCTSSPSAATGRWRSGSSWATAPGWTSSGRSRRRLGPGLPRNGRAGP